MLEDTFKLIFWLSSALLGFITGVVLLNWHVRAAYTEPMEALGIERFQKCEINTPNYHSNWYEIVWKKEK